MTVPVADVECLGCAIVRGSLAPPGGFIVETPSFVLHQDPLVPLPYFLVVTARSHVRSILDVSPDQNAELFTLVQAARRAIAAVATVQRCTIIQEERSEHLHVWLFPWETDDCPGYSWSAGRFDQSLSMIRPAMDGARQHVTEDQWVRVMTGVDRVREMMRHAV